MTHYVRSVSTRVQDSVKAMLADCTLFVYGLLTLVIVLHAESNISHTADLKDSGISSNVLFFVCFPSLHGAPLGQFPTEMSLQIVHWLFKGEGVVVDTF